MNQNDLLQAIGELNETMLAEAAPDAPVIQKTASRLPWRKLGGIALAACLAICAVVGVGIMMKNATPPVSADPGIPAVCAEQGHDYSEVEEVGTGKIMVRCSVCHRIENLYNQVNESEYDSDESHFSYVNFTIENEVYHTKYDEEGNPIERSSESIVPSGAICITGYTGSATKVKFPSEIDGKKVCALDLYKTVHNRSITSVILSDGITAIHGATFYDWTELSSIYFPSSLRIIGGADWEELVPDSSITPMRRCPKLETVYLPDGLTICRGFSFCQNLKRVNVPAAMEAGEMVIGGAPELSYVVSSQNIPYGKLGYTPILLHEFTTLPGETDYIWQYCDENGVCTYYQYINGETVEVTDTKLIAKYLKELGNS